MAPPVRFERCLLVTLLCAGREVPVAWLVHVEVSENTLCGLHLEH
eukprot:CAMPEP_0177747648 /NCGR_PEP_ID=MMETSP0484_2-20121128/31510_1 /TAXON_ID=354590 /ORGANISM="Rhodomonas lens, Strain RHODO" /LENGTH=44 /DNA_ID= /DNA_START= /DNA_END= /DNA_ORIENTATION=